MKKILTLTSFGLVSTLMIVGSMAFVANAVVHRTLTVVESGTGSGSVTSSPAGINCPGTCAATYNNNTVVTLTATAASGSLFSSWTGCGSSSGTVCTVTMSADKSVTAKFAVIPPTHTLSVQVTGTGTVTSSPVGINCGATCQATYNQSTTVFLSVAVPSSSTIITWTGCDFASTSTNCRVTMSADESVTVTLN